MPQKNLIHIELQGVEELRRKLLALEPKVARKVLRKALRAGAKIVHARAKQNIPQGGTGVFARSLKVRAMKRTRRKTIGVAVETREGWYKGEAFYGAFVEFGHKQGSRKLGDARKQIEGKHYIEKAAEQTKDAVTALLTTTIGAGIEAEAAKRG